MMAIDVKGTFGRMKNHLLTVPNLITFVVFSFLALGALQTGNFVEGIALFAGGLVSMFAMSYVGTSEGHEDKDVRNRTITSIVLFLIILLVGLGIYFLYNKG
ncbi:MAG: hypothetical protein GOU99_03375, partial [Candidatus Altiarchaeota archaeon]|nr:hypothetical protein [Candidatus Altiarchaeota archaeon]